LAAGQGLKDRSQVGPLWDGSATRVGTWSGTYIGVHGGGATGEADWRSTDVDSGGKLNVNGGLGGVQVGHNWQVSGFIVGIEADLTLGELSGKKQYNDILTVPVLGTLSGRVENNLDSLMTIRARAGVTAYDALLYATAGVAFGEYTMTGTLSNGTDLLSISRTDDVFGGVVGGGIDWMVFNGLSLRAEVLHYMFPDIKLSDPALGGFKIDADTTIVRGAVNYKLN